MIQTLARNLRQRRQALDMSMHGLAEKSGVPWERINLMEMERLAAPSIQDIAAIAHALYCPIEVLVNDPAPSMPWSDGNAAIVATPDWPVRLIRAARTELAIAKAAGDPFDVELWSRALAVIMHAGSWPSRLVRAVRTAQANAKTQGDPFEVDVWTRAMAVLTDVPNRRADRQKGAAA